MKGDLLCLDLSILDFDLISGENHRDVITNARNIAKPVRHIFVSEVTETMFDQFLKKCWLKYVETHVTLDVTSNMIIAHWP